MFTIYNDNSIRITKGNSAMIDITPISTVTLEPIILSDGDKVVFTIKNSKHEIVFQRVLTADDYEGDEDTSLNLRFDPADTIDLPTGTYVYDCLLLVSDDEEIAEANTFISSTLTITPAVGLYTDVSEVADDGA